MDDDHLLHELGSAMRAAAQVPDSFLAAGRAAYTWRAIDTELASLSLPTLATTREDTAALRSFTFEARDLSIEVEVDGDALLGQIVPPQPGTIELHDRSGTIAHATVDDIGWFALRPLPAGMFRLRFADRSGAQVLTEWVTH